MQTLLILVKKYLNFEFLRNIVFNHHMLVVYNKLMNHFLLLLHLRVIELGLKLVQY